MYNDSLSMPEIEGQINMEQIIGLNETSADMQGSGALNSAAEPVQANEYGKEVISGWNKTQDTQKFLPNADNLTERFNELKNELNRQWNFSGPEIAAERNNMAEFKANNNADVYSDTLSMVKAAYPEENARNLVDLGETFLQMCSSGVNPVTAYEAVHGTNKARHTAPSMGDVGTTYAADKEFYTSEEVDRMSDAEIKRNYDKVRKSMTKW